MNCVFIVLGLNYTALGYLVILDTKDLVSLCNNTRPIALGNLDALSEQEGLRKVVKV